MIIAIDFDGTIVQNKYPEIGMLQPYSVKVINKLYDEHYIIIWTSRSGDMLLNAINFLLEKGIKFHRVNASNPQNIEIYGGQDTRKIFANTYIDDRNLGGFPGWLEVEKELLKQEVE